MKLSDVAIRNAKPNGSKNRKLYDGNGLYLEITEKGKKRWRFRYQFAGKGKCISLGMYPAVKLRYAREQRDDARELLAKGIDPSEQRQQVKMNKSNGLEGNQDTFEAVASNWFNTRKSEWSEGHQERVLRMLEKNLYPWIGEIPIKQITVPTLLEALRYTEKQGKHETVMKTKQVAGQVFRYGIETGQAEFDITANLRNALTSPQTKHMAAIIEPKEVGRLMLAIHNYGGRAPQVYYALRFAPLTFVRPKELRHAEWSEIDWEESLWKIDAQKMKMREDHIVPLSRQAMKILETMRRFTGKGRYIFPNARSPNRPMSEVAILAALRAIGYTKEQMTGHGFRAMARTLLDEQLGFRIDVIEQQLGHAVKDPLGRAYNRTKHLPERSGMMQTYSNYLDDLKAEAANTG